MGWKLARVINEQTREDHTLLKIKDLHTAVKGVEVLKGISLEVQPGEIHAIMGPNGSGKSTLTKVIVGHPDYEVVRGDIQYEVDFEYKNLLDLEPHERACQGIFLAFQYPVEIPGISNFTFLHTAFNCICQSQGIAEMSEEDFREMVIEKSKLLEIDTKFLDRSVNDGFSGGEKKRNEVLQMSILSPRLALIDEIDSGLDIDALRSVSNGINQLKSEDKSIVLITHYQRVLDYIIPDYVHVFADGKIIKTGDKTLAQKLEKEGYDWLVQ